MASANAPLVPGINIDSYFRHRCDDSRIQLPRFEPRAFGFTLISTVIVEKSLCHLTPGGVVNTEE